jgi:two-component system LytT family response regulator
MKMPRIRTLIVDDVMLARKRLMRHLSADPDVEFVGECSNGFEAVAAVRELSPDLVFLDVQMPEMDGFEVLEALGAGRIPAVIFVTAYDQFALRAFDFHALDYLLKPFDRERLRRAVERAKTQIGREAGRDVEQRLQALLKEVKAQPKYSKRLAVKTGGYTAFLEADEIDCVEAEGNYILLRVGKESHLVRERLGHLEGRLDPEKFVRIHRSVIINIDRVKEMHPLFNGDQLIVLHDGRQFNMSRTYRDRLMSALKGL